MTATDRNTQLLLLMILTYTICPTTREIEHFRGRLEDEWWKFDINGAIDECRHMYN